MTHSTIEEAALTIANEYAQDGAVIPLRDSIVVLVADAEARGRKEEREKITGIVEEWLKTSNPAHAQDLFTALTNHTV